MIASLGIRRPGWLAVVAALFLSSTSWAQVVSEEHKGIDQGNYNIKQSVEFGYRADWVKGNQNTYDTFVGLGSGLRLTNYTVSLRSIDHRGILLDNLNFSNFGYGGDPENVSRLRMEKNKWYDFSLVFRRHKNFWDYNLLGNPLISVPFATASPVSFNPAAFPAFAVNNSPRSLYLVRRMQDYDLTLLPQSRVRFRLSYSRNVNEGPSLNSFAGTTNFLLGQNFRMTTNAYHVGVDFRFLPRTIISYDQFLDYNKQDTSDTLANTPNLVQTTTGTVPVNLGFIWLYPPVSGTAGTPCGASLAAAPFPTATSTALGFANPGCKEALSYSRTAPARSFAPTERVSFQSTYFNRLEMTGAVSYNSNKNVVSNLNDSINEWTNGALATTGQLREAIVSGPASARQVAVRANWSGIVSLTQKVRLLDSINYDNWRTAGVFNQVSTNLFGQTVAGLTPGILSPIAQFAPLVGGGPTFASLCPAPYNSVNCPQHGTASAPDVYNTFNATFLGQERLSNTIQLQADLTKRISGRIGYMYEQRKISEIPWQALYPSNTTVNNLGATYYPGGGGTPGNLEPGGTLTGNYFLAARGSCAIPTGGSATLPANCILNPDGSISYKPALVGSTDSATYCANGTHTSPSVSIQTVFLGRCVTSINEHVGLAGLTLRPMDTLRIYADFQFGYNDYSYTRLWPRQIQSYKVHATYTPRTWMTVDGAIDIHENRDNVSEVNNLEHGRTYSFSTVLARNSKLAFTLGYNYSDISLQTFICFRDNFGALTTTTYPGFSPVSGYLFYTPANSACPYTTANATGSGINTNVNLGTTAFYKSGQHYAYSDVMWKPVNRVTATVGYTGTFVGGSTVFLNPLAPAGTLDFNYQKPFASIQFDIYKGLSYKTTWNYYGYNSKGPINPSVTVPAGSGPFAGQTLALQPIAGPDFNGSTVMFGLLFAF